MTLDSIKTQLLIVAALGLYLMSCVLVVATTDGTITWLTRMDSFIVAHVTVSVIVGLTMYCIGGGSSKQVHR
jgi:ribose/xylose/arabinose/galactoside ABC-type transport system permease subunit